jgi:hypothetical protein
MSPMRPLQLGGIPAADCIWAMRSPVLKIDTNGGTMINAPSVIATTAMPRLTSMFAFRSRASLLILNHQTKVIYPQGDDRPDQECVPGLPHSSRHRLLSARAIRSGIPMLARRQAL